MHVFAKQPLGMKLLPSVPLFLAISGFLVLQSYERSTSWKEFFGRRALRVLPAFLAALVLVEVLFGPQESLTVLAQWANLGLVNLQSKDGAVWSLGWEEIHYALLALLFAAGTYRSRRPIWLLLGASVLLMLALYPQLDIRAGRPLALPVAFFIGNLCYLYRDRLPRLGPMVAAGSLAVVGLWVFVQVRGGNFGTAFNLCAATMVGSLAILWAAITFKPRLPRFPDLSYGCYLYHMPLVHWLRANEHSLWWLALLLPAVCLASWFAIESPALRLKERLRARSPVGGVAREAA